MCDQQVADINRSQRIRYGDSRLQEEASSEAYCDEETLKDTEKEDLEADTAKHSSTLETAVPSSTESLNEGHPDKICDQFSDVVLDTCLTCDAKCKVTSETCVKDNMFMVTGEINDTGVSLASEIIEVPVIQTQEKTRQVMNTHVQYVVDKVEVEKSKIIEETVQRMKPIIQEKISQVIKHTDFPQLQFLSKVVEMPVVGQQQASMVVEKTVEIPEIRTVWGTETSESLDTARTRQNDARQQHEQQHHNNQQQSTRPTMERKRKKEKSRKEGKLRKKGTRKSRRT